MAKVILVAKHLHFGEGFENKPLAVPTLYKSFMFTICVAILSIIESMVRGLLGKGDLAGGPVVLIPCFSFEWYAGMLVVFAAFIPFFAFKELDRVLGKGKINELFFRKAAR